VGGATILHVDLDAFYASVEQLMDPSLRGKPVAVGGGVVLAASYEAKAFGVQSGMSGRAARNLCPRLVFVAGHFDRYLSLSEDVFRICRDFTPVVEQISIDEAFCDVSGSEHLFGKAPEIAAAIRSRVRNETGLAISAGVARTKFLAKVASQVAKPDGLCAVQPGDEIDFLHALPVRLIWGVGRVTEERLADLGVATVGQLAQFPVSTLRLRLGGAAANHLHALAWNLDPRGVTPTRRAGSVGAQSAFGRAGQTPEAFKRVLLGLADRVGSRLRKKDRGGRTLTVRVRFDDLQSVTRSRTLPSPIASTEAISRIAWALAREAVRTEANGRQVSLFGIRMSRLRPLVALQLELPLELGDVTQPGSETGRRFWDLDRSIDAVRDRFGKASVGACSVLMARGDSSVPDEFRELAEARED